MADMRAAAVVLAGGRSSRMGSPKAALEWHGSTLLRRTVGVAGRGAGGPAIVVRAPGQPLPALGAGVQVVDDEQEGLGPLQGIAVGLAAARAQGCDAAFVCSTDLPFLHVAFVRAVLRHLDAGTDVVLPHARGHRQPLAAAYATALVDRARALLAAGRLKPAFLFDDCAVTVLDDAALLADAGLAAADPSLESVVNVNEPDDYRAARSRTAPQVVVERFGVLGGGGGTAAQTVHAATLAEAAAAVHLALDRHVVAALNGDTITRDGQTPLVAGDRVAFLAADAGG